MERANLRTDAELKQKRSIYTDSKALQIASSLTAQQVRGILSGVQKEIRNMRKFTDYESMAKLELAEPERTEIENRFNEVTSKFSELENYETNDTQPLVTVLETFNILREDTTSKFMSREKLLSNAPEQHDRYFQVPAAID